MLTPCGFRAKDRMQNPTGAQCRGLAFGIIALGVCTAFLFSREPHSLSASPPSQPQQRIDVRPEEALTLQVASSEPAAVAAGPVRESVPAPDLPPAPRLKSFPTLEGTPHPTCRSSYAPAIRAPSASPQLPAEDNSTAAIRQTETPHRTCHPAVPGGSDSHNGRFSTRSGNRSVARRCTGPGRHEQCQSADSGDGQRRADLGHASRPAAATPGRWTGIASSCWRKGTSVTARGGRRSLRPIRVCCANRSCCPSGLNWSSPQATRRSARSPQPGHRSGDHPPIAARVLGTGSPQRRRTRTPAIARRDCDPFFVLRRQLHCEARGLFTSRPREIPPFLLTSRN